MIAEFGFTFWVAKSYWGNYCRKYCKMYCEKYWNTFHIHYFQPYCDTFFLNCCCS